MLRSQYKSDCEEPRLEPLFPNCCRLIEQQQCLSSWSDRLRRRSPPSWKRKRKCKKLRKKILISTWVLPRINTETENRVTPKVNKNLTPTQAKVHTRIKKEKNFQLPMGELELPKKQKFSRIVYQKQNSRERREASATWIYIHSWPTYYLQEHNISLSQSQSTNTKNNNRTQI